MVKGKPNAVDKVVSQARHGSDLPPKLMKETAAMGMAHRADSISNYDGPHLITHLNKAVKAKNLPLAQEHAKHALAHAKNIMNKAQEMPSRLKALPGVKKEMSDLNKVRAITKAKK